MNFLAKKKDGSIVFLHKEEVNNFLKDMPDDQLIVIDIEKKRNSRTNQQNKMYWGVIIKQIADYTGYTPEEVHQFCKRSFMGRKYIKIGKKRVLAEPSTPKLNTKEFTEYVERILVWSAQELSMEWNL